MICEPDTHSHAVCGGAAADGDGEACCVNVRDDVHACDVRQRHLHQVCTVGIISKSFLSYYSKARNVCAELELQQQL